MAEEPDNLVLRMLRQVDGKLDTLVDRVHDLTARVASVVVDQLVAMRADTSALRGDFARLEHCMDKFDQRLRRIERRLDLIEA